MANDRWREDDQRRWDYDRQRGQYRSGGYDQGRFDRDSEGSQFGQGSGQGDYGGSSNRGWSGGSSGIDDRDFDRRFGYGDYNSSNMGGGQNRSGSYGNYGRQFSPSDRGYGASGNEGYRSDYSRNYGDANRNFSSDYNRGSADYNRGFGGDYNRGSFGDHNRGSSSYGGDFERGYGSYGTNRQDWRSDSNRSDFNRSDYNRGGDWRSQETAWNERNDQRNDQHRGWLDKAADAVSSWMGGDERSDANRGHYGRGPKGYTRSDERIREDVNDRLTDDWRVDASNIDVSVKDGEVTLTGTVNQRDEKRRAEDIAESISGVRHVQNNLRYSQQQGWNQSHNQGSSFSQGSGMGQSSGQSSTAGSNVGASAGTTSGSGTTTTGSTSGSTTTTGSSPGTMNTNSNPSGAR